MAPDRITGPVSLLDRLAAGRWLSRRRVVAAGIVLLAVQLAVLGFLVAGAFGVVGREGPDTISFVGFYAAGQLANRGEAGLVYDPVSLGIAEQALTHPGVHFNAFPYPPIYLLLCAPLARLPMIWSLVLFEAATLGFYLAVVKKILRVRGWAWLIPALAFPATFWAIGYGQNSFLTAALFGAGTLLIDERPVLAGLLFGMLCFKPNFGLLIPVALVAGKRWPAVAGAAAAVGALSVLSVGLFGWEAWRAFAHYLLGSGLLVRFQASAIDVFGSVSPFAGGLVLGLSYAHARLVQLAATALSAVLVGAVWRRAASLPLRSASLVAGALIATPYALLYDLMLGAIAGAWLLRAGRDGGFLAWEKTALAAIYVLPIGALQAGIVLGLPLAPLAGIGLVWLCAVRALREWKERRLLAAGH